MYARRGLVRQPGPDEDGVVERDVGRVAIVLQLAVEDVAGFVAGREAAGNLAFVAGQQPPVALADEVEIAIRGPRD